MAAVAVAGSILFRQFNRSLLTDIGSSTPLFFALRYRHRRSKDPVYKLPSNAAVDMGVEPIKVDLNQPMLYFDKAEELQNTTDERIKKIFSLAFAKKDDLKYYEEKLLEDTFKANPLETDSLEADIALHTIRIRRLGNLLKEFPSTKKNSILPLSCNL